MRSNDDIIRVLNEERTKQNLSISELSRRVGMAKSALSRYFNKTREFPLNKAEDFASALGITSEYLLGFEESSTPTLTLVTDTTAKLEEKRQITVLNVAEKKLKQQQQQQQNLTSLEEYRKRKSEEQELRKIDWYGVASAGTGEFLTDETCEEIELPVDMIPDCADFCLNVNGDSMQPVFQNGDYIFIEKQTELFSGAIGVVIVNNEAFLKRVWFENNHARLESFNKTYEDIIVTEDDDFRIIGKVVM